MRERGETKRMLEKELKVLGLAERVVKRIACTLQCASTHGFLVSYSLSWDGTVGNRKRAVPCCAGP